MPRYGRKRPRFNRYNVGAMKMSARVRRALVPAEKKYVDTESNFVGASGTVYAQCLSLSEQGADATTRIGNKIMVDSIGFKMEVIPNGKDDLSTAESSAAILRLVVVIDKQANGSTPAWGDIFVDNDNMTDWRNLEQTSRFRILYDKVHVMPLQLGDSATADSASAYGVWRMIRFNHKFKKPLLIQYDGTASPPTAGQIRKNSIWLFSVCTNINDVPQEYQARMRFTDA